MSKQTKWHFKAKFSLKNIFLNFIFLTMTTKRKLQEISNPVIIPTKRAKFEINFNDLPQELILLVFSYLKEVELWKMVRPVCRKWKFLSSSPLLWKNIHAGYEISTDTLLKWIRTSPLLKKIDLQNRADIDEVLVVLSKYARCLQHIKIDNCWGTKHKQRLKSTCLCRLVQRCDKLETFHFNFVKILSCKFFRLLSSKNSIANRRSRNYSGPVNRQQLKTLLQSLDKSELYNGVSITDVEKKVSLKFYKQNLEDDVDIWETIVNNLEGADNIAIVRRQ